MDDGKLLKPAAGNKPESTPSLDQAVDNFVGKLGMPVFFIFMLAKLHCCEPRCCLWKTLRGRTCRWV